MNKLFLSLLLFCSLQADKTELLLQDCINYALKHAPEIKKSSLAKERSKAFTQLSLAEFDFSFSHSASRRLDQDRNNVNNTISKDFDSGFSLSANGDAQQDLENNGESAALSLSLSKRLLGGGHRLETRQDLDDNLIDEIIAQNSLNRQTRSTKLRITQQYYQSLRAMLALEIQERQLNNAKKNLEIAEGNDKSKLDISTAAIQVADRELSLLRQKRVIATQIDSLKESMGYPLEKELLISKAFAYQSQKYNWQKDLQQSQKEHEDFLNIGLERLKLERNSKIRKQKVLPTLDLTYNHQLDSTGDSLNLESGPQEETLSLNLNWDWGQRADKANLALAKNRLSENKVDFYALRQNKAQSLRQLHRRLLETQTSIAIQKRRVKLGEYQLELYKDRWTEGEIDILEYIRSQNDLENNKVTLINLKTTYMEIQAEYKFEVGK